MSRAIPLVDLSRFTHGNPEEQRAFVGEFGNAFRKVGFAGVVNHGIPATLVDSFYQKARTFFALPQAVKDKYEIPGLAGQRGYTSFGKEHAKGSLVPDLKEFFQIGPESGDHGIGSGSYGPNVEVLDVEGFNDSANALFRAFQESGAYLLQAVAEYLELDRNYFEDKIRNGNSILRAIHYPPITREPKSAIRAESHEDINLITLLVGASAGGLQVLSRKGEWRAVVPGPGEIVVNVGDMLQRLTNNYLRSTTHRVVNPPREEWHLPRLSIPFFLHPRADMALTCLDSCVSEDQPPAYEPLSAGAYLEERLEEIGLKS